MLSRNRISKLSENGRKILTIYLSILASFLLGRLRLFSTPTSLRRPCAFRSVCASVSLPSLFLWVLFRERGWTCSAVSTFPPKFWRDFLMRVAYERSPLRSPESWNKKWIVNNYFVVIKKKSYSMFCLTQETGDNSRRIVLSPHWKLRLSVTSNIQNEIPIRMQ